MCYCKIENKVSKNHIIAIATLRIVTERNAPHEKRIRVEQPVEKKFICKSSYAKVVFDKVRLV